MFNLSEAKKCFFVSLYYKLIIVGLYTTYTTSIVVVVVVVGRLLTRRSRPKTIRLTGQVNLLLSVTMKEF